MGRSKHRRTAPPSQSEHSDDERENHDQSNCEPEDKLDYEYLVDLLVKYGRVLLTKSRVPSVLIQKKAALEAIANRIFTEKQIRCSETQIMRRVAVYKSRLKQKTDVKQTGNRKIVLSDAEKRFWKLMDGDSNPTLTKVEFGAIAGGRRSVEEPVEFTDSDSSNSSSGATSSQQSGSSRTGAFVSRPSTAAFRSLPNIAHTSSGKQIRKSNSGDESSDCDMLTFDKSKMRRVQYGKSQAQASSARSSSTLGGRSTIERRSRNENFEWESDETSSFSLNRLQRYVLLYQLKMMKEKRRSYAEKKKNNERRDEIESDH